MQRQMDKKDEFGLTLLQDYDNSEVPDLWTAQVVTSNSSLDKSAANGLLLAMIVAKHTQSNAVVIATEDHSTGIGAGQQSRIAATRIACEKAETDLLYDHPKVLDLQFLSKRSRIDKMNVVDLFLRFDALGAVERATVAHQLTADFAPISREERASWIHKIHILCLASDAAIPFRDNIDRAAGACVTHVVQPGGSKRDPEVTRARHFLH